MDTEGDLTAIVSGVVQGVGFRFWTRGRLVDLGLSGTATNLPDGTVEVKARGRVSRLQTQLDLLSGPTTPGRVREVRAHWG